MSYIGIYKDSDENKSLGMLLEVIILSYKCYDINEVNKYINESILTIESMKEHDIYDSKQNEYIRIFINILMKDKKYKILKRFFELLDDDNYNFEIKCLENKILKSNWIYKIKKWYKTNIRIVK